MSMKTVLVVGSTGSQGNTTGHALLIWTKDLDFAGLQVVKNPGKM